MQEHRHGGLGGATRPIVIVIADELSAAFLKVVVRLGDAESAGDDEGEEGDAAGDIATTGDRRKDHQAC